MGWWNTMVEYHALKAKKKKPKHQNGKRQFPCLGELGKTPGQVEGNGG